jgi:hypothetical protein
MTFMLSELCGFGSCLWLQWLDLGVLVNVIDWLSRSRGGDGGRKGDGSSPSSCHEARTISENI